MSLSKWNDKNAFFILFAYSFIVLYFVFSGTILIPFYHHDIYKFSMGGPLEKYFNDEGFYVLRDVLIRPIAAYLDALNFKFANTLERMSELRFITLGIISIGAALFARWLTSQRFTFWQAFFISNSVFFCPACKLSLLWVQLALFWLLSWLY
jgi:hypothetical protein